MSLQFEKNTKCPWSENEVIEYIGLEEGDVEFFSELIYHGHTKIESYDYWLFSYKNCENELCTCIVEAKGKMLVWLNKCIATWGSDESYMSPVEQILDYHESKNVSN